MKTKNKTEIMVLCCTECNECYDAVNGHKMSWQDVEDNNDPEYNYVTQDGKCEKCMGEIKEMEMKLKLTHLRVSNKKTKCGRQIMPNYVVSDDIFAVTCQRCLNRYYHVKVGRKSNPELIELGDKLYDFWVNNGSPTMERLSVMVGLPFATVTAAISRKLKRKCVKSI